MRCNGKFLLKVFFVVGITGLLIGCAMLPKEKMASSSTDYNLVVEKAQNKMLLLNIVRASRRYPMYFTSFNALRGNMTYSFSTGNFTIPFGSIGGGFNGAYQITPVVGYSSSPNFDLTVLDTQEFTRGIMTPVSMSTIDYYLKSGWPKELLLHLFIERIELNDEQNKKNALVKLKNDPNHEDDFKKFKEWLQEMDCEVELDESELINPFMIKQEVGLKDLMQAQKAGFEIITKEEKEKNWYQLKSKTTEYILACKKKSEEKSNERPESKLLTKGEPNGGKNGKIYLRSPKAIPESTLSTKGKQTDEKIGSIYPRSPEAILYYLGQIVRVETEGKFIPKIRSCDSEVPIFLVHKSMGTDNAASVTIDFEGLRYSIPRDPLFGDSCRADRTMQVLSLISLLIGQQKKIEQVPVTGVVNVIGR